jgi:tetratricopeptide (TPR) repeat protein
MTDTAQSHPAIAVILMVEGTPAFLHAARALDAECAVATQLAPESLPPAWTRRLALRYADVLVQTGALDRAAIWADVAGQGLNAENAHAPENAEMHARWRMSRARVALRSGRGAQGVAELNAAAEARALCPAAVALTLETDALLAQAEAAIQRGEYGAIVGWLAPRLELPGAFGSVDALWRAHRLIGFAAQATLRFARARAAFEAAAALARDHDAADDEADALTAAAQCALGAGDLAGARGAITRALAITQAGSPARALASTTSFTLLLASDEPEAALSAVQRAGIEAARANDAKTYLETVGVSTHLRRMLGQHAQAYRELLGVYGLLTQRFGADAAAPIVALMDTLRADLGDAAFEALSAELLAERAPGT